MPNANEEIKRITSDIRKSCIQIQAMPILTIAVSKQKDDKLNLSMLHSHTFGELEVLKAISESMQNRIKTIENERETAKNDAFVEETAA